MLKPTLKTVYADYEKYNGKLKSCYASLYKMAKGKKEVPEETPEARWFISAIERMHRADKKFRDKVMEKEQQVMGLKSSGSADMMNLIKQLEDSFAAETETFYIKRFKQVMEYLCYIYKFRYEEDTEKKGYYTYKFYFKDELVIYGTINTMPKYITAEIYRSFIKIEEDLDRLRGRSIEPDYQYKLNVFMNELSYILNHSDLRIS